VFERGFSSAAACDVCDSRSDSSVAPCLPAIEEAACASDSCSSNLSQQHDDVVFRLSFRGVRSCFAVRVDDVMRPNRL
jgi:hypothetical protein